MSRAHLRMNEYHLWERMHSKPTMIGEAMANENVTKFEELLRTDEALQARLQQLVDSFEGDATDEQAVFDATLGKMAAEAGLPFTLEEGREVAFGERPLSDGELDAAAGGSGACYVVGYSTEPEVECTSAQFHACAYAGLGFPDCS